MRSDNVCEQSFRLGWSFLTGRVVRPVVQIELAVARVTNLAIVAVAQCRFSKQAASLSPILLNVTTGDDINCMTSN